MTKPIAFVLILAGLLSASEAEAGHKFHRGGPHRGVATTTTYGATTAANPSTTYSTVSDYNNFTFRGRPYGHPYDPWTWPYMSGAYGQGLARYYDPPVK